MLEPTFEVAEPFVNLTIRFKTPLSKNGTLNGMLNGTLNGTLKLSEIEKITLDIIRQHPEYTLDDIGKELGRSRRMVSRYIAALQDNGIIKKEGSKKIGKWIILKDI